MRIYPNCPNCNRVADSTSPKFSLYKCGNCGDKYCTHCGGDDCPKCGDSKRMLIGRVEVVAGAAAS